ncbi:unnamed protein product [Hymenolepis diminuta]|uniref:PXA domain-containing protein n=1 Tax=Hymenolepis diminuta TaxID=6216 RepID=A0A0R3STE2_HYMDI|nr:unnamed protein product [Hymenolepis diminuta]
MYFLLKDALTVRRMDSPFSPSSWQEKDFLAPWRNSRPSTSPANDAMSVTSADCLRTYSRASPGSSVYSSLSITGTNSTSRLTSTPTGSLIVFRVHSAITDDAQSLVEFLTILLSEGAFDEETKSPTVNPQESGTSKIGEDDKLDKKRSSTGFKVRISESSFEWQDHPEKPPFAAANQPTPLRTYSTFFCDWLREINAVRREVMRALLLGPFLMLHNLMMVPADLGLLPSLVQQTPSEFETATSVLQKHVYRRIQLPLDKLLHVQKVTKASLSEISMSLLSGALRAYQQMSGMKKPPDLLIRTCTPTPNFEMCSERLTQPNYQRDAAESDIEAQEPDHNEAVTALSDIVNGPPAHCIYTLMQLPLSEEGMIPRLWRVHQRVTMLHRTALAVTLEWIRDLLHLLLPHWLALRADSLLLGGASKCSVTFAEVSLENTGNVEGSSNSVLGKRSKSGSRRKSKLRRQSRRGMANQSSLKMDISQALRLVNRPNSLNDSSNSSVYEGSPSNERNLDLIYLSGGVPIVRIEAWLANHRDASSINESLPSNSSSSSVAEYGDEKKSMCRDLAVVTCVYGSHLTVGVTANCQMDGKPGLDLILNTMLKQLNNLYKLIDSRFPAKPVIYAPRRRFHLVSGAGSSSVRMRVIQGSPRTQKRPSTSTISPQLPSTTIRESHSPDIMIEGELIEWNENQFLKYNFPPLSSSLRKSSLRKTQKRHSNEPVAVEETPNEEPTSTSKLVPILKSSSSVVPTETEVDEQSKRKRTSESLGSNGKSKHAKKQRRLGISKKVCLNVGSKKHPPPKLPSPAPRRSQVRFATEDN